MFVPFLACNRADVKAGNTEAMLKAKMTSAVRRRDLEEESFSGKSGSVRKFNFKFDPWDNDRHAGLKDKTNVARRPGKDCAFILG
jgi:hypothetical protein